MSGHLPILSLRIIASTKVPFSPLRNFSSTLSLRATKSKPTLTSNTAAWNTALGAPLEVKPAPLGIPGPNQILIKNHAIAINLANAKIQYLALYPMTYPTILGEDVAGEVISIGPGVTRFKKGDRVTGFAVGHSTKCEEEKAFQAYTVLQHNMACEVPDVVPSESAVVLPLGLLTASDALFNPEFLNFYLPTEPKQTPTGKTLLVWGGASNVGSNATQLAVSAGYEVIATCSPKNFSYVKKLGATQVFDYSSPTVVSDIINAFEGKTSIGAFDAIGAAAWAPTLEVIQNIEGVVKFVATVFWGLPEPPEGITMKKVFAPSCKDNFVGKAVWEDVLPLTLKARSYIPAPEAMVVGKGLESLQGAVGILRTGVSLANSKTCGRL